MLAEQGGDVGDGLRGADGLAAVLAVEHRDRQAPAALTGDAPVGAVADHGDHAVLAPRGKPFDIVTGGDGLVLEGLDGAEPLRRSAEDDRALAAPAVRIAVSEFLGGEQRAALLQVGQNGCVGLVIAQAGILARSLGLAAAVVHGDDQVDVIAAAGLIVVRAEARGGVDAARAGIHRDIVRADKQGLARQERMLRRHILKIPALMALDDLIFLDAAGLHRLFKQRLGDEIALAVCRLDDNIALLRVQGDGEVAGQRPRRRRPDDNIGVFSLELALRVLQGELDIDGRAGIVLILDFGLGQRRLVLGAPVHGLQALVDIALAVHLAEDLDLLGLKGLVHGFIGMLPVAEDAEAAEAAHLTVDEVLCKGLTGIAELRDRHGLVVELVLLDDGGFNGHAVVVPAGNIGRVIAAHRMGADDEVLERLIECVAHVDIAVGERRAVVQDERRLALVLFEHQAVDVDLVPVLQHARLALRQARAHREVRLRGDDGVLIVHKCLHLFLLNACNWLLSQKILCLIKRQRISLRYHSCSPGTGALGAR